MAALAPVVMAQPHRLHDRRPRPVHSGRPAHHRLRFGTGLPHPKRRRDRSVDEPISHPPLSATSPASATPPTSAAPASATPTTSAPAAGSATGTNPIISPSSTPAPGADAPTPTRVALEFATAWTRTTSAQPAWLVGLKPLVTPEYMTALSTVDPARVPATRTLDAGRLLSTSGSSPSSGSPPTPAA